MRNINGILLKILAKSKSEKFLKIDQPLPKLWRKTWVACFLTDHVVVDVTLTGGQTRSRCYVAIMKVGKSLKFMAFMVSKLLNSLVINVLQLKMWMFDVADNDSRLFICLSVRPCKLFSLHLQQVDINNNNNIITRGQSNLTKSASRGAHSPIRGHPRGSKVVPTNQRRHDTAYLNKRLFY